MREIHNGDLFRSVTAGRGTWSLFSENYVRKYNKTDDMSTTLEIVEWKIDTELMIVETDSGLYFDGQELSKVLYDGLVLYTQRWIFTEDPEEIEQTGWNDPGWVLKTSVSV